MSAEQILVDEKFTELAEWFESQGFLSVDNSTVKTKSGTRYGFFGGVVVGGRTAEETWFEQHNAKAVKRRALFEQLKAAVEAGDKFAATKVINQLEVGA